MSVRTLCVLGAALTYEVSRYLALAFIVGAVVLPWCAVIMANDRMASKPAHRPAYRPGTGTERMLTSGDDDRTVDG